MKKCECCEDLQDDLLDWECLGEAHEGENTECGECNSSYYREFNGTVWATDKKAKEMHPELKIL